MDYPKSKTVPWEHQVKAWWKAKSYLNFYFAIAMGGGKSKLAIDYATAFDAKKILILCPKNVLISSVWNNQFTEHSFNHVKVISPTKGSVKKKTEFIESQLNAADLNGHRIAVIINYDSFWRPPLGPDYNARNKIINPGLLAKHQWDLFICDEIHRIKDPGGKASWGALRIGKSAKRKLGLSGTPFPNSPNDIYAQFRFLDKSIYGSSFQVFRNEYNIMGGYQNKQVVGYKNLDDLNKKFYSIAYRIKKEEALPNLIPPDHQTRICQLNPDTRKLYDEFDKELVAEIKELKKQGATNKAILSAPNTLVKLLRLAQLAGGFIKDNEGNKHIIDDNKLNIVKEIIEDIGDEPVVIFCRFTNEIERLIKMLEGMGKKVSELSGRRHDITEWQNGKTDILTAQIQAGSEGIDLTRSCYCIFFSIGYSLGVYDQACAREDRPGQKYKVTFFHIIAEKTVDEKIKKAIDKKIDIVECILEEDT